MSGGRSQATQTQQSGPPAYLQPYLNYGLQQGTALYQSPSPSYYPGSQVAAPSTATQAGWQDAIARAQSGSPVNTAAASYLTGTMGSNPGANVNPAAGTASNAYLQNAAGGGYMGNINPSAGTASNAYMQNVIGGGFLGQNPYQDAVNQAIYASVIPQVNAQFSLGGRYGSGAQSGTLGTAIASQIAPLEYQQYGTERGYQQQAAAAQQAAQQNQYQYNQQLQNAAAQGLQSNLQNQYQYNQALQQQAAGMAPTQAAQDWTDIQGLLGVGGAQDQLAQQQIGANVNQWNYNQNLTLNKLAQYMQTIGAMPGASQTSTSTPAGSDFGSILASIGGGILGKVVGL